MITNNSPITSLDRIIRTLSRFKIINQSCDVDANKKVAFVKNYSKTRMVLLMGSNPGNASLTRKAFDPSTKSRQVVDSWFYNDKDNRYYLFYDNLYNNPTPNNRPLNSMELSVVLPRLNARLQPYEEYGVRIVACGGQVSKAFDRTHIHHFHMPHPSGANRFWNNKENGELKIREMRAWAQNDK